MWGEPKRHSQKAGKDQEETHPWKKSCVGPHLWAAAFLNRVHSSAMCSVGGRKSNPRGLKVQRTEQLEISGERGWCLRSKSTPERLSLNSPCSLHWQPNGTDTGETPTSEKIGRPQEQNRDTSFSVLQLESSQVTACVGKTTNSDPAECSVAVTYHPQHPAIHTQRKREVRPLFRNKAVNRNWLQVQLDVGFSRKILKRCF